MLRDLGNVRWTREELLNWLNDGQAAIVIHKPNACVVNEGLHLSQGTKQRIPAAGVALVSVTRNLGADGNTPGRAVRLVDRAALDARRPGWHGDNAAAEIRHYTFSDNDPHHFYVYPPADGTSHVEIVYSASPEPCESDAEPIAIDDIYQGVLVNYILFRAYSKDADSPGNAQKALAYNNLVRSGLGLKAQAEWSTDPNVRANTGPSPSVQPQPVAGPGGIS